MTAANALAVIPARYASSRFPGKMIANRTGKPLIQHVYERATEARTVAEVVVATDDERIADVARGFGSRVVMTGPHPNGTSRIAETVATLGIPADALVVNVQGDEPELDPALIDCAVEALRAAPECVMSTIASPFAEGESPANPNIVKVVVDRRGRAMYFSRARIPHVREPGGVESGGPLKHVGLYVYRRAFLNEYGSLEATPLELAECLEQLRVLEHGHAIAVAIGESHHTGIDTPEQYEEFVGRHESS